MKRILWFVLIVVIGLSQVAWSGIPPYAVQDYDRDKAREFVARSYWANEAQQVVSKAEVLLFLNRQHGNWSEYEPGEYMCGDFTFGLWRSARDEGIRAGVVFIGFEDEYWGHYLIVFPTIDRGYIFVEPQTDRLKCVEVGHDYWWGYTISEVDVCWDTTLLFEWHGDVQWIK